MKRFYTAIRTLALMAFAAAAPLPLHAQATPATPQGSGAGLQMLQDLQAKAEASLNAGDGASAAQQAALLLKANTDTHSWNYGNVVYDANQIAGRAALLQGNVPAAKEFLLAAGKTPGSPQLDSFGPTMTLAQELLKRGEKQTVLTFLDEVFVFWATPSPHEQTRFLFLYKGHAATIRGWQAAIRAGKPASLDRFDFSSVP